MKNNTPLSRLITRLRSGGRMRPFVVVLLIALAFALGVLLPDGGRRAGVVPEQESAATAGEASLWTCSMHPSIKSPKPGKCPICFMDLIPLETGTGAEEGPRQLRMSETAVELARIQTAPVRRGSVETAIRLVGRITYDETALSYITAWVPGRIERLYADFTGVRVKMGEPLVDLYAPELLAAQEELIQARATLAVLDESASPVLRSTADATVASAREKLRLLGLTREQIAAVEARGAISDRVTIHAPAGGVVIHKDAKEGMYVQTGTRIYTIADLSKLWVTLEAYESDLPFLRDGQTVEFTTSSVPGKHFAAVIDFIDPFVDPHTRTVTVRGTITAGGYHLKPDMFVRGVVNATIGGRSAEKESEQLLIPATAPLLTGTRAVVYVEVPNEEGPLFEGREVELGPRAGDFYIVESGVNEGERVVTNGAFKIDSELQIRAKPSMMAPEGGAMPGGHSHVRAVPGGTAETAGAPATRLHESERALAALAPVYDAYFDIHMALAGDDRGAAAKAADTLRTTVARVEQSLFSPEGERRWLDLSAAARRFAGELEKSTDIASARTSFFHLSNEMIRMHDTFGHADGTVFYRAHCPMAFDGSGADWLQTADIVWNPFYGERMLRCGTIRAIPDSLRGESD